MEGSDVLYLPISFSQRKTFGLIDENAAGLTDENTYQITDDDLGGVMGIVGDSQDEGIIGETVYHFIKFPSDDAICIVKVNGIYQFYVKEDVAGIEETNNPDINIDAPVDKTPTMRQSLIPRLLRQQKHPMKLSHQNISLNYRLKSAQL